MCKILCFAGITEATQKAAWKFAIAAVPSMSKFDKDGVGYTASAIGTGDLFGERWLKPGHAFDRREIYTPKEAELVSSHGMAVDVEESYNTFGTHTNMSAITLHTRFATCGVSLRNVHPFVKEDTSLIHNGVIRNHDQFKKTLSSCDSEAILASYLDNGVDQTVDSVQDMANALEGYYACGVLARNRDGIRVMDIFKSDDAQLYVCWVKSINTWAYCTSAEILRDAAKRAKTQISTPQVVKPGWLIRIVADTGAVGTTHFSRRPKTPTVIDNNARFFDRGYDSARAKAWSLDNDASEMNKYGIDTSGYDDKDLPPEDFDGTIPLFAKENT